MLTRREAKILLEKMITCAGCFFNFNHVGHNPKSKKAKAHYNSYIESLMRIQNLSFKELDELITCLDNGRFLQFKYKDKDYNTVDDEIDYFSLSSNGRIYIWTETAGNIYYLDEYKKTWFGIIQSEKEYLREQKRRKKERELLFKKYEKAIDKKLKEIKASNLNKTGEQEEFTKFCMELISCAIPDILAGGLVEVCPIRIDSKVDRLKR